MFWTWNESVKVKEIATEIRTEQYREENSNHGSKCKWKYMQGKMVEPTARERNSDDERQTFFSCLSLYSTAYTYKSSVDYDDCWIPSALCNNNNIRIAKNKRRKNMDTGSLVVFIQFVGCLNEKLSVPFKWFIRATSFGRRSMEKKHPNGEAQKKMFSCENHNTIFWYGKLRQNSLSKTVCNGQ